VALGRRKSESKENEDKKYRRKLHSNGNKNRNNGSVITNLMEETDVSLP
jgi:hypothetical protein